MSDGSGSDALTRLARDDAGRVLALLAARFGDLDLADDAVQDALVEAVATWPAHGVPANPAGWLHTVARRKALDRVRRRTSAQRRTHGSAAELVEQTSPADDRGLVEESGMQVPDERLRLLLLCCHPALSREAQVCLTLRLVGGLTTAEIAAALLVEETTVSQRIVRAKRKIREAGIPLTLPTAFEARLEVVLDVLYLIFNEGYLPSVSAGAVRVALADEALRLTRLVRSLAPVSAETAGLLALELFQRSRFATRADEHGDLVLLEDQDRSRWDSEMIAEGNVVLADVLRSRDPGPLQVQAVIAAQHANARTAGETDWTTITTCYAQLVAMADSPVVRLNRAVAVGMADGPLAGLARLDEVVGLEGYHLLHAVRGDLLERAGRPHQARTCFARAARLTENPTERRLLERRARR